MENKILKKIATSIILFMSVFIVIFTIMGFQELQWNPNKMSEHIRQQISAGTLVISCVVTLIYIIGSSFYE